MNIREEVKKVLDTWADTHEDLTYPGARERLLQGIMEAIDDWADGVERAHRELKRELKNAISDYSSQPEIGFMTIKWLLKEKKK